MVCFRYIIVNTLHKLDDVDDVDNNNNNNKYGGTGSYGHICTSKQTIIHRADYMKTSGLLCAVCVENNKLTVLNMRLDDLSEHSLSVIDLKTKLKISPTNKSTWH